MSKRRKEQSDRRAFSIRRVAERSIEKLSQGRDFDEVVREAGLPYSDMKRAMRDELASRSVVAKEKAEDLVAKYSLGGEFNKLLAACGGDWKHEVLREVMKIVRTKRRGVAPCTPSPSF